MELADLAVDFEAEQVLPLGAARVQPGDLAGLRLQQREPVVFDFPVPEKPGEVAGDFGEIAQKPAREVDQVDALVEHLAAAGDPPVAPPLLFHAEPPALAVAAADEHEGAEGSGLEDFVSLPERGVEAVVEPDLHNDAGVAERVPGRLDDGLELGGAAGGGLFHQDVLAPFHRRVGDRGEHVVRRRDDDDVDVAS